MTSPVVLYVFGLAFACGLVVLVFFVWPYFSRQSHRIAELEASPIPTVITDNDGKIEYVNPKYTQLTGYDLDDVKAKLAPFFHADMMQPEMSSNLWETVRSGQVWHGEFLNQAKSGESFYAAYSITPILDDAGQVSNLVTIVKNISDRKRVEAERLVSNRTREFATLYEMTHDLGQFSDRTTLFGQVLERILVQLDVHSGAIYLYDAEHHTFNVAAEIGPPFQFGPSVSGGEWLSDTLSKTYLDSPSTVRVPIIHANECLGMLVLRLMQLGSLDKRPNLNLLALIASQVASAIHNLNMFDQVRASRLRAEDLAKSILSTQEKERRSIARELHDEFGQELTSVQLGLQGIEHSLRYSPTHPKLNDIMGTIEHLMEQMRDLSRTLRPAILDDFGLVPALEWLVEQQVKPAGIGSEIVADRTQARLPEEIETVCFRVAQEAITNILRHGHAKRVFIQVSLGIDQIQLTLEDNGVGFELPEAMKNVRQGHSLGLLSMQERVELIGGKMQIITAPRRGTRIEVSIPIDRDPLVAEADQVQRGED